MKNMSINLANWDTPPFNRRSFLNMSDFMPVKPVLRGDRPVREFGRKLCDLNGVAVTRIDGDTTNVGEVLDTTQTDGFLVIHRGYIVMEEYFNGMKPDTLHLAQSVSKSVVGTLVGIFINRGLIERDAFVTQYLPQLQGGGYCGATVDHLINMQTGIKFDEDYTDPEADFGFLDRASGWKELRDDNDPGSIYDLIVSIKGERDHGEYFQYRSIDTDVLGWICERVGGAHLTQLIGTEIWSRLGAEYDASFTVDRKGTALADGGFNATLRDLGRFAQMYLDRGVVDGRQIACPDWIKGCQHGDTKAFGVLYGDFVKRYPNSGYSNQWWVVNATRRIYSTRGVFGLFIYIDPEAEVVIVKFSTWPTFLDVERGLNTYRMAEAIAAYLARSAV
jgi:CubicO group peptidase (beta-lactamase class C family)